MRALAAIIALLAPGLLMADVGDRHTMLLERARLESEIAALSTSSPQQIALRDSLLGNLIALDARIFSTYEMTIHRLSRQRLRESEASRWLAIIALGGIVATLLSLTWVRSLQRYVHSRFGSQPIGLGLLTRGMLRVRGGPMGKAHPLVVLSLLLMAGTVAAYLAFML